MSKTNIPWATDCWNAITGCSPISDGCLRCYAAVMAERLHGRCGYPDEVPFDVTIHMDKLCDPPRRAGARVFVDSMGDLFHKDVPLYAIDSTMINIAVNPQTTYIVLTKRARQMAGYMSVFGRMHQPVRNLWMLVTAENQECADQRIPDLLSVKECVGRIGVSFEPLLEPIRLSNQWLEALDWVIIGAESGANRRPCARIWVVRLVKQCADAGVPVFLKQMDVDGKLVKVPVVAGQQWAQYPEVAL